ncbi:MAG: hypothetical protein AAF960_06255 [Bacteroidota bacterium]
MLTQLEKFWQAIEESSIGFVRLDERTQKMIIRYWGAMREEIERGQQQQRSTYAYFDLLEIITYELITIHGFEALANSYAEEKGWIKTEIKNTLNFAFQDAFSGSGS